MKKHLIIQQQYFDLLEELNSSNPVKYKKTPIYFYTERVNDEDLLFAAISDWQKRVLCKKKELNFWLPTRNTNHEELEIAIAKWIPGCVKQPDLTKCIKNHIFNPNPLA